MNTQALKFMRAYRYELKDKSFHNFVIPALNMKEYYYLQQNNIKEQSIPIFFRRKVSNRT